MGFHKPFNLAIISIIGTRMLVCLPPIPVESFESKGVLQGGPLPVISEVKRGPCKVKSPQCTPVVFGPLKKVVLPPFITIVGAHLVLSYINPGRFQFNKSIGVVFSIPEIFNLKIFVVLKNWWQPFHLAAGSPRRLASRKPRFKTKGLNNKKLRNKKLPCFGRFVWYSPMIYP